MTFLESTNFFVRVIMFDFLNKNNEIKLKFKLVPMIHIGTKEYYDNIFENLKECDEIFYEGLYLNKLSIIFKQYKSIANKLGLVTQREHFKLRELNKKLTHTDLDYKAGKEAWRELKFIEKIKLQFVEPLKLFLFQQVITREVLAKHFMTSSEEAYLAYGPIEDEEKSSANLIMNMREQIIFKNIRVKIKSESHLDKTIGIVYGAAHMKSIARYLIDKFNYIPRNGIFVKVFNVQ